MKLTTTIKNFKNNIIGYFSSSKSNGGEDNEGLYVVPASLLNGNKSIQGFYWKRFVKAEFITKEYDNLFVLTKGNQYSTGKINIYLRIGSKSLNINDNGKFSAITIDINNMATSIVDVKDNNSIINANEFITNFLKQNITAQLFSFEFVAQSGSTRNTTDDISRFLSCINIYYKP